MNLWRRVLEAPSPVIELLFEAASRKPRETHRHIPPRLLERLHVKDQDSQEEKKDMGLS